MSGTGWKDIWDLAVKLVIAEPPAVEIAIGLGVAFSVLMFIEGLRANFAPRRATSAPIKSNPPSASSHSAQSPASYRSLSATTGLAASRNLKRREVAVSRYRAPRPKVRRIGTPLYPVRSVEPANDIAAHQDVEIAHYETAESLPQVATFEG